MGKGKFMASPHRRCPAGLCFHVFNRAVNRRKIFLKSGDYWAFMSTLEKTWNRIPLSIHAMVIMPNHWHFVVKPTKGDQVSKFFHALTTTHAKRWREHDGSTGLGHVYQGRFKAIPVEDGPATLAVMRYVERNPLQAKLVKPAESWRWGSAWIRANYRAGGCPWLVAPEGFPPLEAWFNEVNRVQKKDELVRIQAAISHGFPYGSPEWVQWKADELGLKATMRPPGRPRNDPRGHFGDGKCLPGSF